MLAINIRFNIKMRKLFLLAALVYSCVNGFSQQALLNHEDSLKRTNNVLSAKSLLLPAALIGYGINGLHNPTVTHINKDTKEELWTENPHNFCHIDNYLQFSPGVAVFALNIAGVKGEHNLRDAAFIYAMSNVILNSVVYSTKTLSKEPRPDGSSNNSFPSGHTAEAFASAEFLRQEYKNVSPWYGVGGYAAATATAYLRMYNNKHWLSDVAAGAGIGILSTKLAYWLYPKIRGDVHKTSGSNTMIVPAYSNHVASLALVKTFN